MSAPKAEAAGERDPDACNEGSPEFCDWPQCACFATVYPWTLDAQDSPDGDVEQP